MHWNTLLLLLLVVNSGCLSFRAAQKLSKSGVILTKALAQEMEYIQNQLNEYDELKILAAGLQGQQSVMPQRTGLYELSGESVILLNALANIYEEMREIAVTEKGDTSVKGEDQMHANETIIRRSGEYACMLLKFKKSPIITAASQSPEDQKQLPGNCLRQFFSNEILDRRDTKTQSKKIEMASVYLRTFLGETHKYIEEALKKDEFENIKRNDHLEDYLELIIHQFGPPSLENIINNQFNGLGLKWKDIDKTYIDKTLESSSKQGSEGLRSAIKILAKIRIRHTEEMRAKRLNNLRSALKELKQQHSQLERGQPINDELILSYLPSLFPYISQIAPKIFGF